MKDEYVRKQNAVDALEEKEHEPWYLHKDLEWMSGVVEAKDVIKSLEPADVVPVKHGMWIPYRCDMYECSKCRAWKKDDSDYCPDCGAKMNEMED